MAGQRGNTGETSPCPLLFKAYLSSSGHDIARITSVGKDECEMFLSQKVLLETLACSLDRGHR